jgi:hypothetical protein
MDIEMNRVFVRKSEIIERPGDELLLFDPDKGTLFEVNETGKYIWYLLDGKNTISDIETKMKEDFEDTIRIKKDLKEFINRLIEHNVIELSK